MNPDPSTASQPKPKSTRAQANKTNAARSTGPKSPAGKRTASRNALRHGLTGHTVVLPSDDVKRYRAFRERFTNDLEPSGVLEESLVQSIADCAWRLERSAALEANLLSLDLESESDPAAQLGRLSLYSQRITRMMHATLTQLRQIQKERRDCEADALEHAADIRKYNESQDLTEWEPADPKHPSKPVIAPPIWVDGFVFSLEEIDAYIERQTLLEDACTHALRQS